MRRPSPWTFAAAALLLALAAVIVRLAWLGDDAYITLRTVENWLRGHGLCWNVGERVQTFTHPLWMLLLAAGRWLTGECYFTTIWLSVALSLAAAVLLAAMARQGGRSAGAAAVLALLLASRSFVEFATSGLETPLVFVLLALLAAKSSAGAPAAAAGPAAAGAPEAALMHASAPAAARRRLFAVALLTGLLATTRMDLGLLCAPALLAAMRGVPGRAALPRLLLGLSPFLAWELFATVYYGSPFPITAYAKAIAVGIPTATLLQQGLYYWSWVATHDPLTLAVIVAGIGLGLWHKDLRCRALAFGALLYCGYVLKVGGDFMAGRFALPPFVLALAVLARALATAPRPVLLGSFVAALGLLLLPGWPAWLHGPASDAPPSEDYHGIIDERAFYCRKQGLLSPDRDLPLWGKKTLALRALLQRQQPVTEVIGMVGRDGFEAGELVHIVDPWLLDPLLMRLPVADPDPAQWRIGHFKRRLPEGYLETIASGENRLRHPGLRALHDALHTVITAPVFDGERLSAMGRLWRGDFEEGLRDYIAGDYRQPPRLAVAADALADVPPMPVGRPAWWFDRPTAHIVYWGGLEVRWPAPATAARLRLWLYGKLIYRLTFRRDGREVGRIDVDAARFDQALGLQQLTAAVPPEVGAFDSLWIDVPWHPSEYVACLGGLWLEQ